MERQTKIVDAIDEGRIVRVPEEYAIQEGLPILRRQKIDETRERESSWMQRNRKKEKVGNYIRLDDLRKPLRQNANNVSSSLIENFHWKIREKRRQLNITRKQLSSILGIDESDLKLIENGIIPRDDFVLINKIQEYFNLNLRKDGQNPNVLMRKVVESGKAGQGKKEMPKWRANVDKARETRNRISAENLIGDDIEIIE